MVKGVNKVILLGNVGQDPKVNAVATTLSLATSESWTDKQTGERTEKTEWHNVVFFNKLGDVVRQYVHKGSTIYVEGKINTTKYTDKQTGQEKYSVKVVAEKLQLLDKKGDSYAATNQGQLPVPTDDFDNSDIPF